MLHDSNKYQHEHISDFESVPVKEITICIYRNEDLSSFDERSKTLILEDK